MLPSLCDLRLVIWNHNSAILRLASLYHVESNNTELPVKQLKSQFNRTLAASLDDVQCYQAK